MATNTISLDRASDLLRYSQNDEKMPTTFHLKLAEIGTRNGAAMEFVGTALRNNNSIVCLYVDFSRGVIVPEESVEDLLHFISNCSSLRFLVLVGSSALPGVALSPGEKGRLTRLGSLFLDAAARSKNIEGLLVSANQERPILDLSRPMAVSTGLKLLKIFHCPEGLENVWPSTNMIEQLDLDASSLESQPVLSKLMERIETSGSEHFLKGLYLRCWIPSLPSYLANPKCRLETLCLSEVDFSHSTEGRSAMDGLLRGLLTSQTKNLIFGRCSMDQLAMAKLLRALQSGLTRVNGLGFYQVGGVEESLAGFFACKCLQELCFDCCLDGSTHIRSVHEGIQSTTIPNLMVSTDDFTGLGPALKAALTSASLRELQLLGVNFDSAGSDCLASLLADEECQLEKLTFFKCAYADGQDHLFPPNIFNALEANVRLQELSLQQSTRPSERIICDLLTGVELFKNLKVLEIVFEWRISQDPPLPLDERVAVALSQNWHLEQVKLQLSDQNMTHDLKQPASMLSVEQKIQALCQRNKMKNKIDAAPVQMSLSEKVTWIQDLHSMWSLPDGLTLAFSLLLLRPACFFTVFV